MDRPKIEQRVLRIVEEIVRDKLDGRAVSSSADIATDGAYVYFTNAGNPTGTVMRCPVAGCSGAPW